MTKLDKGIHNNCPPYLYVISGRYSERNLVCLRYTRVKEVERTFRVTTCNLGKELGGSKKALAYFRF